MRDYNERTGYDCFYNPFLVGCDSPYLNLPPMSLDAISRQKKRDHYTPDPLPAAISVVSGNSVSTLTTPLTPHKLLF